MSLFAKCRWKTLQQVISESRFLPNCNFIKFVSLSVRCIENYWNISTGKGCQDCNCNPAGSQSLSCDLIMGQCQCRPGFQGTRCHLCKENHYGNATVQCLPCNCNHAGSNSAQCDSRSGQCHCLPNFIGEHCDR